MFTEKRLVAGTLLSDSATTLYTATALKTIIKEMTFCNTDSSTAYKFTLHIVPKDGTLDEENMEFNEVSLNGGETKIFGRSCVLENGSTIQALADTSDKIAFSCSGVERT